MKLDLILFPSQDLSADAALIQRAEQLGFAGAWTAETAHNPFFPLTAGAKATAAIQLGTQIAVAFPRSPMVTAQIAWDLARQSRGRFILGLGSQERVHIERRFGETWADPVGRMREYIESLRAIWHSFQTGGRLRYRGEHYQFRLMAPFFNPGPITQPNIPIYLAGADPRLCELAGELCQGLHVHPLHTAGYLREIVSPALARGLRVAARNPEDIAIAVPLLIVTGSTARARRQSERRARQRIAFYAGTGSFARVMQLQGWGRLAEELRRLARESRWGELQNRISDDMLREFAIVAEPHEVMRAIEARYRGIADRLCLEWRAEDGALIESILRSRSA